MDALRRKGAQPADPRAVIFLEQPAHGSMPEDAATVTDETNRVRTALSRLPSEQRRALVLSAFYGYTAREISQAEAIPLGTAKARVRRGLMKVRSLLGQARHSGCQIHAPDDCRIHPRTQAINERNMHMSYNSSTRRGVVIRPLRMRHTLPAVAAAVFAVLLGSSAAFASAGNTGFGFNAPNISGASGAVFLTGGGAFNSTSGFVHSAAASGAPPR